MTVALMALFACGGPEQLPRDGTFEFMVTSQEDPLECHGFLFMSEMRVHASCIYTSLNLGGPFGRLDTFEAVIEYLPQADEVWLHFIVPDDDKRHYPASQGMPMAIALKPGGRGWTGSASYYPRDAYQGYMDLSAEAWY